MTTPAYIAPETVARMHRRPFNPFPSAPPAPVEAPRLAAPLPPNAAELWAAQLGAATSRAAVDLARIAHARHELERRFGAGERPAPAVYAPDCTERPRAGIGWPLASMAIILSVVAACAASAGIFHL